MEKNVIFMGIKTGQDLVEIVSDSSTGIVPSAWEEALGGVAIELMAAGKNLIVSKRGGLKETVGDAGLTFPNGDAAALSQCMKKLLENEVLAAVQRKKALERAELFNELFLTRRYIELFEKILCKTKVH